ncbi:hypothetical protein EDS67_03640 [candidate division KSB1 bacterium]|nr:MAG: hypothetical protein EDS67_03640 [candidate division KSB1 bacterium]MBC6947722.1 hypothetical protein [candidate division KSB1 bacterium]MCE7940019.1 hypothetical protein [Chlorobi bacterium CHB1]
MIQVPEIFQSPIIINLLVLIILILTFSYLQLFFVRLRMQRRQSSQEKFKEDADVIQGVIFPYNKNEYRKLVSEYFKSQEAS